MEKDFYGWLALASSNELWSDIDFDNAFETIKKEIEIFEFEERNEIIMPDMQMFPQMIYFKGSVESFDKVENLLNTVLGIMDNSFGELLLYENIDVNIAWDFSKVTRYQICDGKLNILPNQ